MTFELPSLGWDDDFAAAYARFDWSDARPARVTRVDRGICTALATDGPLRAGVGGGLLAAAARDPVALPCAGDWVVVRGWPERVYVRGRLVARGGEPVTAPGWGRYLLRGPSGTL